MQKIWIVLSVFTLLLTSAYSVEILPSTHAFRAKSKIKFFKISNSESRDINIDLAIKLRHIDSTNKEKLVVSKDFLIEPAAFKLKANKKINIKVTFIGADSKKEEAYRLIAIEKEVHIDDIEIEKVTMASLYILPVGAKANLNIVSSKVFDGKLFLVIENLGSRHSILQNYFLSIKQGKSKFTYDLKSKKFSLLGQQNLLPGNKRRFQINSPKKFKNGDVLANFIRR